MAKVIDVKMIVTRLRRNVFTLKNTTLEGADGIGDAKRNVRELAIVGCRARPICPAGLAAAPIALKIFRHFSIQI